MKLDELKKQLDQLKKENEKLRSDQSPYVMSLLDDNKKLKEELRREREKSTELIVALSDMVAQHCYIENSREVSKQYDVDSNCLHANADAMRLLGKLGVLILDDRGMRVVFGKWPNQKDAREQGEK